MKKLLIATACAFLLAGCANTPKPEAPASEETEETTVTETSAIVGKWQLDKVYGVKDDESTEELDPETNQSLYSIADGYFEFKEDGTGVHVMNDGSDTAEVALIWTEKDGAVTVSEGDDNTKETEFTFEEGTLVQYAEAGEGSGYTQYKSVFAQVK